MAHAEVNVHGQITLPSTLRARHGIFAGSTVCIEERGNEIVISKAAVIEDRLFRELAAIARKNGTTKEDVVKAVRKIGDKIYAEESGA